MISCKDEVFSRLALARYDPVLIDIVEFINQKYKRVIITSAFRLGDSGVHGTVPGRGMDIRSWIYIFSSRVVKAVNAQWIYDPRRPKKQCAILHKNRGGRGKHIHLQVHRRTELKNG